MIDHLLTSHVGRFSDNEIRDDGARVLSEALCHPNCKLKSLNIAGKVLRGALINDRKSLNTCVLR